MSIDANFFNTPCEDIQQLVTNLMMNEPIFRNVFSTSELDAINIELLEEAKTKFSELHPNEDLMEWYKRYRNTVEQDICNNAMIFDSQHKKYYNPKILTPIKQNTNTKFNAIEFLKDQQLKGNYYIFNFNTEYDVCLDIPYEERKKFDIMVDQSLKSMGELILILNQNRSTIPYHLVDLHNEARIN